MPVNTAAFLGFMADDSVVYGSASGVGSANKGDWVAASGYWFHGTNSGFMAAPPAFKVSGVGIAIDFNPWYDELGVARAQSALAVATRGIFRVTASSGASAEFPVMTPVYPRTTGSGMLGTSGATGIAAIWGTAPPQGISANPTGALASGVAQILKVISDGSTGQWDILLTHTVPTYF